MVTEFLEKLQQIISLLNSKIFNNIFPGQNVIVVKENFNNYMNKISSINAKSISGVDPTTDEDKIRRKIKSTKRIRYMQSTDESQSDSIINLDQKIVSEFMKTHHFE